MSKNVLTYGDAFIGDSLEVGVAVMASVLGGQLTIPALVTPVNAVLATGGVLAYVNVTNPTATKKVTIPNGDGTSAVYTFVAAVAVAGDVKVGASADATMTNLERAINKSGGTEGVSGDYMSFGGAAHPLVSAAINAGADSIALTVLTKGVVGNIDITTDEASITPTDPTGGVDGTVGSLGDVRVDAGNIYVCTADNTSAGQNWKAVAISAI